MRFQATIIYLTYLLQAVSALLTGGILFGFHTHYHRRFLVHWTRSWFATAVMLLAGAVGLFLASDITAAHPAHLTVSLISSVAGYLMIGWLLLGTHELATGKTYPRRDSHALLIALGVVGVVLALLFVWDEGASGTRQFLRVGVRSFIAGVAFCIAAVRIWRAHRSRRGIGHRLLSGAFLLYGLEQLHFATIGILSLVRDTIVVPYALYLGFFDLLLQFAMALGMVIWLLEDERKATIEAAQQIQHLAFHDTLTGLPNRQLFLDRLDLAVAHAHRGGHQLAVFFLDLDRFKVINDSLGHSVGDRLLQLVAARVKELLREEDTVTRLGGDEFTILAPQVRSADDAIAVARKVRDAIKLPFLIDGRELFVTTSIGISMFPGDGEDAETLVKNADSAMYRAKAQGRDIFQLYTSSMNDRALEQLALENSLRRAVMKHEFVLHYQPVVDMPTGRITGMETVLRWWHPEFGLLLPDDFITLAETTGLIVPLGEWVLRTATAQVKQWQERGHTGLRASVNLSVRQLQQPDFVELVSQILAGVGLAPTALELEITESIAMQQTDETVLDRLRALKRLGVRIAIDDFGTGFSSLGALRLFPVDALKIDRSFVRDVAADADNAAIAHAVIALAHSLKLTVIAEGVETTGQLEFLRARGCDMWQGWLYSHPAPAEACDDLLAKDLRESGATVIPIERRRASGPVRDF